MESSSLTWGQIALGIVTAFLAGSGFVQIVNKIGSWWSGRSRAEVIEIHTRNVKVEAEAQQTHAQTVMDALERIRELVEINSELKEELDEARRDRDNAQWELRQEHDEYIKLQIQHNLREHFIKQLEAANELGIRLKDLTPEALAELNAKPD